MSNEKKLVQAIRFVFGCLESEPRIWYNTHMNTTTPLETYFQFERTGPDNTLLSIRVAGTRVGIEYVLREYVQGASPEELALRFPTLSLEQIHATITFFLAQNEEISRYLRSVWQQQQSDSKAEEGQSSTFFQTLRAKLDTVRHERFQDRALA